LNLDLKVLKGLLVRLNFRKFKWPSTLIPIDLPDSIIRPEVRSEEKRIQAEREQMTLALLVFKHNLPESASEPDANGPTTYIETKMIPLEDTGTSEQDHQNPYYQPFNHQHIDSNLNLYDLICKTSQLSPTKPLLPEPNIELVPAMQTQKPEPISNFALIPNNHILSPDKEQLKIILKNAGIPQPQIVQQEQNPEANITYVPPLNPNPQIDKGLETFLASFLPANTQPVATLRDEPQNGFNNPTNDRQPYSKWSNSGWSTHSRGYNHNKNRSNNYSSRGGYATNRPNYDNRMQVRDPDANDRNRNRDGYRSTHRSAGKQHTKADNTSNSADSKNTDQTKPSFRWV
jgi:hypothetical protein